MATETLRIYKHGSGSYTDVTSATTGGFTRLTRTQVLSDVGSLDFTLACVTPASLASIIDEAATVEYWEDGAKLATYVVDDYTPHLMELTCDVKCVGELGLGASPGAAMDASITLSQPADLVMSDAVAHQRASSGTGIQWAWDAAKVNIPFRVLLDAFPGSLSGSWARVIGSASASASSGNMRISITGSQEAVYVNTSLTPRADMCVQVMLASAGSAGNLGIVARYSSTTSFYLAIFNATTVVFYRKTGATYTALSTSAAFSDALVVGDALAFSVIGSALTAYVNGVQVHSDTDTVITAPGIAGVRGESGTTTIVYLDNFAVTTGALPPTAYALDTSNMPCADAIKAAAQLSGMTFWLDSTHTLNAEPYRTAVDKTYTLNVTLRGFDPTYSARGVVNQLVITYGSNTWVFQDAASIAQYGMRSLAISSSSLATAAQAQACASTYFDQWAQPRMSIRIFVDHDATLRPGLLVAVTGMGDGRTYQDLIQQITWTVGDLYDELVLGTPALALKG
jgi:hypothetical protein